jgi:putative membrane protein
MRGYTPPVKLSRIIINGVALIAAALIVPGIKLDWGNEPTQTLITLVVLAVVFGIINAYIRPVLRALSLPINLVSMGLFGFFLNAGLLLLLAWLVDQLWQPVLRIGGFPPNPSTTTLTAAIAGALVITVVSTFLSVLMPDA